MEEGSLLAQLVTVTNRAANDAALHITAAFVGRNHTVGHQEGGSADVVSNHLERRCAQVFDMCFAASSLDQCLEQVDLVIAVHVLQDGSQTLQPHAGVHARRGQLHDRAIFLHIELHEHVVPDLNEAVAVFVRRAGRATGNVFAVVVENFRARTAGTGVGHHPEVVALVLAAFVVADADDALGR